MKQILSILLLFFSSQTWAQDIKPISPNFYPLQSPSFSYYTSDSSVWIYKGAMHGWTKLTGDSQLKKYYVPYTGAIKNVNLGNYAIISNSQNIPLSNGVVTIPSFTNNNNGSITVGTATYTLNQSPDNSGITKKYLISGGTFTLTNEVTNYIVADYNSGTPIIRNTVDVNEINETTIVPIFTLFRDGLEVHEETWDNLALGLSNKLNQSIVKTQRFRRESGLALSESSTRIVNIGSGVYWRGAVRTSLPAFVSTIDDMHFYFHSGGTWSNTQTTQYNNYQYDDGTNLQSLSSGKYAVNFVYKCGSINHNDAYIVLGSGNFNLSQAQTAQPPSNLPTIINSFGILVGRIIVAQGASVATQVDGAFQVVFTPSPTTDHSSLSNLTWGNSGHIDGANTLAAFDSGGTATTVVISTFEPALTKGNLTESVTGLQFSATRQVIGGASDLSLSSGYLIPTTASATSWDNKQPLLTNPVTSNTPTFTANLLTKSTGTVNQITTTGITVDASNNITNAASIQLTTGASANTLFGGDASGNGTWKTVNQAIGGNALTTGYLPYWDGSKLANSIAFHDKGVFRIKDINSGFPSSGSGFEMFVDNLSNSFIQSYNRNSSSWNDITIRGNNVFFWGGGSERFSINLSGQVKVNNLSGTGTRVQSSASDGTLGTITNGTDTQVLQMISGNPAFGINAPEVTNIKATGGINGYVATANGSGGIELRQPSVNVTSFVKQKSPNGIYNLAHSSIVYNDMLFIGERAANPKVIRWSNLDNLATYSSTTISGTGVTGNGLDYGYYVSSIGKICFTSKNPTAGLDIVELNPTTMAYTIHNFPTISGTYSTSGTDGTYIYVANPSYIKKIRVSDWTEILSVSLPANIQFPHSIQVNAARNEFYLTGSIADPIYVAKVSTTDLSSTTINLGSYVTRATDDMFFYDDGTTNRLFVCGEQNVAGLPYGGVMVDFTNGNALTQLKLNPSYGLFRDGVKAYSCGIDGNIQTFSVLDPTNISTFPMTGFVPNEILITSGGRSYFTNWDTNNSVFCEFFVPIPLPTSGNLVSSVFGRTGAVTAQSGDYSASQVTNAADKSTDNTFSGDVIISKSVSPYFTILNTGGSTTGGGFRIGDENGLYRGTFGYNNNTNETYFYNQFDDPYKFILNNTEQFRMKTDGVFETRNLSSLPGASRSGFGGFFTYNNLPYFINSSGVTTQLGAGGGSMVYPSGSGLTIVNSGSSWGTTIAIPGGTDKFLRSDGTFATPTFTSQWTTDANGITYSGNVGIGVASSANVKQTVLSNTSGYPALAIQNTNASGNGLFVYGGNTSGESGLFVGNYAAGKSLFDVRGDGQIWMPNIANTATSYGLYYNPANGSVTYGTAGGGGGSGTVTNFSSGNLSPLFTTSVSNPTTTPSLSFSAVSQAQNLVYASPNGSSGTPSFRKVVVGDISASGTPSANTYLRGDGTWGTMPTTSTAKLSTPNGSQAGICLTAPSNSYYNIRITYSIIRNGAIYGYGTCIYYAYWNGSTVSITPDETMSHPGSGITTLFEVGSSGLCVGVYSFKVTNNSGAAITIPITYEILYNGN